MEINGSNYQVGNQAMASVLLLYYHLLVEGGITNDQAVYVDQNIFDGYSFLNVEVTEQNNDSEINEKLIREGAVIYLLCDLNDIIGEYEDNYLNHEYTIKLNKAYKEGLLSSILETDELFKLIIVPEQELNYNLYNECLCNIYNKYVVGMYSELLCRQKP